MQPAEMDLTPNTSESATSTPHQRARARSRSRPKRLNLHQRRAQVAAPERPHHDPRRRGLHHQHAVLAPHIPDRDPRVRIHTPRHRPRPSRRDLPARHRTKVLKHRPLRLSPRPQHLGSHGPRQQPPSTALRRSMVGIELAPRPAADRAGHQVALAARRRGAIIRPDRGRDRVDSAARDRLGRSAASRRDHRRGDLRGNVCATSSGGVDAINNPRLSVDPRNKCFHPPLLTRKDPPLP